VPLSPPDALNREMIEDGAGPGHPVARRLKEGDAVADFVVIETPGHSPGHICFWRESDRLLIAGDVITNRNYDTGEVYVQEPPDIFTLDPAANRESIRKIAALDPLVVCLGHGPVLTDPDELHRLVERLPTDAGRVDTTEPTGRG
jgi:hydroxyacylglutathione hydrolase